MKLAKKVLENLVKSVGYEAGDVSLAADGHWHKTEIDLDGNGRTVSTLPFGSIEAHEHKIVNGEIKSANGHTHDKVEA